jgi:hypothetical protein
MREEQAEVRVSRRRSEEERQELSVRKKVGVEPVLALVHSIVRL